MQRFLRGIGLRIIPGLMVAMGVTLVTAGLFTYFGDALAGPPVQLPPIVVELTPSPAVTPTVRPSLLAEASPDASAEATQEVTPEPSVGPSAKPSAPAALITWPAPSSRVATRVTVPDLGVDLPVIAPNGDEYPLCDVAMYFQALGQPGSGRGIYIYAHARAGMFLSILDSSKVNDGRGMLGMQADVYTSDNLVLRYAIFQVRRHQTTMADAFSATSEQLWLQTSEGPSGTPGKTQVLAKPLSASQVDPAAAHPRARPRVCG